MTKYCVVLGASGEIGQSICRQLAKDGWSLYMHYNSQEDLVHQLKDELLLQFETQKFIPIHADFTLVNEADRLAKSIVDVQAIVVANGQALYKLLTETTINDMDELWRVHVQNPIRLISLLSHSLRTYETSYIVFIGSIWGETGGAGEVFYSTVKGAQHSFIKAYAKEAAFSNIRVNAIAPGWIDTTMNSFLDDEEAQLLANEIPLRRAGKPVEVANYVQFLLSGKADYTTGQIIQINGGWYI